MARLKIAYYFRQKPRPPLGLVDPVFDQAGRGDIVVLCTDFMCPAQETPQFPIVRAEFSQHLLGKDGLSVVVFQALMFGDIADGMQGVSANLAGSLRNVIGHGENLFGLFVEEPMIVAKMAAAHVPVEILRFEIERKHVGKQSAQIAGDFLDTISTEIGCGFEIANCRYAGIISLTAHCYFSFA